MGHFRTSVLSPGSLVARLTVVALVTSALAACGGSAAGPSPTPTVARTAATTTDVTFLQEMLPHHQRAIEIATLAETHASDPRVRAFAQRIVGEQTPELQRMQQAATTITLDTTVGAAHAEHRVTDAQLAALAAATGPAFDRSFLQLSIASEQGAVAMSQPERHDGQVPVAVALANAINGAPTGEIPALQRLLTALPPAG